MKSIRIGNDIRIEWPIVLSGDVSKLQDLDLTVEVRPSRNVVDWHNYIEQPTLYRGKQTVMMNGGMEFRPDMGDGKEHCISHRPKPPVPPVKLPYHIENNTLIAMWTADRQFAVGDYDIIVYAHKNGGGQAVADTYRFVRLVPHTAQADGPDNSGIEAVITMQPLTLCLSGLSAYEVAVVNGFQGSVEEWLESLKAGKLSSFVSVESIDNLPQQGDESTGYIIGTKLYIYVGTGGDTLEGKYKDVGEFRGPQGAPGSNGKSAYELAVEGGYEGSVEEWLLSLKGRDGVDGVNGKDGLDGENGKDGVTPLIRWNNNRLEQSTDNGKSWWALSDKFNNKLYIKGYVTSADKLPKNALVGDMYGVGPIYGDDDVEQTKPYYQVYVNTVTDWAKSATITKVYQGDTELPQSAENNEIILIKKSTDNYLVYKYVNGSWNLLANLAEIYVEKDDIVNRGDNIFALVQSEIENQYELYERVVSWRNSGTFTSITAGIVNELGTSENAVMSQKSVTKEINNLTANTGVDEYPTFSTAEDYKSGDTVNYQGKLYRFTTDHAAGAWTETDVEEWSLKKEVDNNTNSLLTIHEFYLGLTKSDGTLTYNKQFFILKARCFEGQKITWYNTINEGDKIVANLFLSQDNEVISHIPAWLTSKSKTSEMVPKNSFYIVINGRIDDITSFYLNIEDDFEAEITEAIEAVETEISNKLELLQTFNDGKYYTNTGEFRESASFFSVKRTCLPNQKITFYNSVDSSSRIPCNIFFGEDGETVIDTFACWTKPEQVITLTVPENAYYFGLSGVTSRKSKFYLNIEDDFEAEITQNAKDISAIKTQIGSLGGNPFAGKKLVVSGDSIAYGAGNEGKGYGGIIAEMYGMTFVNNGVSGTTMRVVPDHTSIPLLFKGWKDNEIRGWGDADYILLEGGYNDIYYTDQNLPEEGDWLGTFDENYELSMSADNANVSDVIPNTFYARLDFYLSYVSRYAKKDAKIIYVIAWKQNNANKLVDENTEGSQGDWMKVYNAIHKCCKKYGIPIVDMWGESRAIATLNPYKQYTNNQDGVHPTDEGYRLYWVNPIVAKMRDI